MKNTPRHASLERPYTLSSKSVMEMGPITWDWNLALFSNMPGQRHKPWLLKHSNKFCHYIFCPIPPDISPPKTAKKNKKEKEKENIIQHHFPVWWLILCVNLTRTWVPRYLAKHYLWVCLWGCFWMRLASELADWVKQVALPNVSEPHPSCGGSE